MKTKYIFNCLALAFFLILRCDHAAMAQSTPKPFPGSDKQMKDASERADLIVVASIEDLGFTIPSSEGQVAYHAAKITVKQALKGDARGIIVVSLVIRFEKGRIEERTPEVGNSYIFFIRTDNETKRRVVIKVLPDDPETLSSVRSAIAAHL